MIINIPEYFNKRTKHNTVKISDLTLVRYRLVRDEKDLFVFLQSNLLIIVLNGMKMVDFDNESIELKSGDILFLRSGSYIMSQIVDAGEGGYESLLMFISDEFIREFRDKNTQFPVNMNADSFNKKYHLVRMNRFLKSWTESVLPYLFEQNDYSVEILKLKIYEILYNLINHDPPGGFLAMMSGIMNRKNPDLSSFMENNFTRTLKQQDFAKLSGRSLTKFKEDFKSEFGMTYKSWINEKRLDHSRFLLGKADRSITDICYFCGFENLSNFINLFKKKFGLTPKQYQIKKVQIR